MVNFHESWSDNLDSEEREARARAAKAAQPKYAQLPYAMHFEKYDGEVK